MKITKQLINKFRNQAAVRVKWWNGTFKRAEATVMYSNGWKHRIEVDGTHPLLAPYCNSKLRGGAVVSQYVYPTSSCSGFCVEVPEEILFVKEKLAELVKVTDEEAIEKVKEIRAAIEEFNKEMGVSW